DEERVAEPAEGGKRVLAGAGDADRRVRLLIRPRHRARLVEAVEFSFVRKAILSPRLLEDVEGVEEALAAFRIGHAIGGVAPWVAAAPGAEDKAAAADDVDGGGLLGEP